MITYRSWRCPHGYTHRIQIRHNRTPTSGQREKQVLRVSTHITAARACPWCQVNHRSTKTYAL